jgi:hypothetical protein
LFIALSFSGRFSVTVTTWGTGDERDNVAKLGRGREEGPWGVDAVLNKRAARVRRKKNRKGNRMVREEQMSKMFAGSFEGGARR